MSKHNLQERLLCNYHTKQVVRWDIVERPGSVKLSPGVINQVTELGYNEHSLPARERLTNVIVKILPNPHLTNEVKKYLVSRKQNVCSLRHIGSIQIGINDSYMDVHLWLLNCTKVIEFSYRLDSPTRNEVYESFECKGSLPEPIDSYESLESITRRLFELNNPATKFDWTILKSPGKGVLLWENSQ